MTTYKLLGSVIGPCEETGGQYMAEVPSLPGCRAWGDTHDEALENITSVASEFILSYVEHGDELPTSVTVGATPSEILVAV